MRRAWWIVVAAGLVAGCGSSMPQAVAEPPQSAESPAINTEYAQQLQYQNEYAAGLIAAERNGAQQILDEVNRLNTELESTKKKLAEARAQVGEVQTRVVTRTIEKEVPVSEGDMDFATEQKVRKELEKRGVLIQNLVEEVNIRQGMMEDLSKRLGIAEKGEDRWRTGCLAVLGLCVLGGIIVLTLKAGKDETND